MAGFHVYITTSPNKTAYYVVLTNDLEYRIIEHYLNRGNAETFAGKYYCYNLVYYEYVDTALEVAVQTVFLHRAFETQKLWMNFSMYKHRSHPGEISFCSVS